GEGDEDRSAAHAVGVRRGWGALVLVGRAHGEWVVIDGWSAGIFGVVTTPEKLDAYHRYAQEQHPTVQAYIPLRDVHIQLRRKGGAP
ncbi:MAG: hypothetical protein ACJARS_003213, partial [bacterium]